MANPNVADIVEEDVAELQFPKAYTDGIKYESNDELEISVINDDDDSDEIFTSDPVCLICKILLIEPYIKCAVCENNVIICPNCFSNGLELNDHKNNHDYIIIKNEFPLIENSNWTAKEELKLLDVIQECGFGNWLDISIRMDKKTPEECKNHYLNNYINNQTLPGLPKIKETEVSLFGCEPIPYMFKLNDLEEPPRFTPHTTSSRSLAGYNPARSDFTINYDNYAEALIAEMKYDEFYENNDDDDDDYDYDSNIDYNLGRNLQIAVIDIYNNKLKERNRRRKIVREHGLIANRKTLSWLNKYENTITRIKSERLLIFMQLINAIQFDYFMEGLHHFGELKNYLYKLFEFRSNGLKHFYNISMYQKLYKIKQENDKDKRSYMNNSEYNWKCILPDNIQNNIHPNIPNISQRKIPPPLVINGLPGHEKLTPEEKELCSNSRIIPESYIDYKNILITESKKVGYLKLAQARVLLKIDVNKTRKIYDFLLENGYIDKAK